MKRSMFVALAAALLMLPAYGFAQDGEEKPAEDAAAADGEAKEGEAKADGDAKAEGEAKDGETAEGEPKEGEAAAEGEPKEGDVLGPGGKPLRTDYPGTEESLKARMDVDKIEGLEVDPNKPEAAYGLRIRELETKIDDLKEKVFQSKTRIVLLRETLLSGNLAGSRAIIRHKTDLGSSFRLRQALYSLDGTRIYSKIDKDGDLAEKRLFEVYNGSISPGNHNLSIFLKYQGSGYGLFPYFKGYDGDIRSSCEFNAQEGKVAQITVMAFQDGNVGTSVEQRPNVRCEVQFFDNVREDGKDDDAEKDKKDEE